MGHLNGLATAPEAVLPPGTPSVTVQIGSQKIPKTPREPIDNPRVGSRDWAREQWKSFMDSVARAPTGVKLAALARLPDPRVEVGGDPLFHLEWAAVQGRTTTPVEHAGLLTSTGFELSHVYACLREFGLPAGSRFRCYVIAAEDLGLRGGEDTFFVEFSLPLAPRPPPHPTAAPDVEQRMREQEERHRQELERIRREYEDRRREELWAARFDRLERGLVEQRTPVGPSSESRMVEAMLPKLIERATQLPALPPPPDPMAQLAAAANALKILKEAMGPGEDGKPTNGYDVLLAGIDRLGGTLEGGIELATSVLAAKAGLPTPLPDADDGNTPTASVNKPALPAPEPSTGMPSGVPGGVFGVLAKTHPAAAKGVQAMLAKGVNPVEVMAQGELYATIHQVLANDPTGAKAERMANTLRELRGSPPPPPPARPPPLATSTAETKAPENPNAKTPALSRKMGVFRLPGKAPAPSTTTAS